MHKRITVYSNDPNEPRAILSISGEVLVDVRFDPRQLSFGELQKGESAQRTLSVDILEQSKLEITQIKSKDPRFTVTKNTIDHQYTISFSGHQEIGRIQSSLLIHAQGEQDRKNFVIPLHASVVDRLRYPKRVRFSRQGKFQTQRIEIQARTGAPAVITKVVDPDHLLSTTIQASPSEDAAPAVLATLQVDKLTSPQNSRHTLLIYTRDVEQKVIKIDYIIPADKRPLQPTRKTATEQLPPSPPE